MSSDFVSVEGGAVEVDKGDIAGVGEAGGTALTAGNEPGVAVTGIIEGNGDGVAEALSGGRAFS